MKIAISKIEITPNEPSYLCGHALRVHLHEGVLDPLYCSVVLMEVGNKKLALLSFDLIGLDELLSDSIRKVVSDELDIKKDNVITSVIHTHAGPEVAEFSILQKDKEKGVRAGYRDELIAKSLICVKAANLHWTEVTMEFTKVMIEGYYGNRNSIDLPSDKSVNLFRFMDKDRNLVGMMVNMSTHPTVLGPQNYFISADLLGAVRQGLEDRWNVSIHMTNGSQGDVSNRQYRQGNDEAELKRVAKGILEQIPNELDWVDVTPEKVHIHKSIFVIRYTVDKKEIERQIIATEKELAETDNSEIKKLYTSGLAALKGRLAGTDHVHMKLTTYTLDFSTFKIVTIPGELFAKLGLEIKNSTDDNIILFGLTNTSVGYFVEESQYGKNYESLTTNIRKGEPEMFIHTIIEQLQNQKIH